MFKRSLLIAIMAVPILASAGLAQTGDICAHENCAIGWDAPLFFSPRPMDDIGVYAFRTNSRVLGDPTGLKAIWRQTGNINLGVHAGFGDLNDAGKSILLGAEFSNSLSGLSSNTGLAMAWSVGAGAVFGKEYIDFSAPLGVSVGLNLGSGSTVITPYANPRVSLDVSSFNNPITDEEITDTNVGFEVDLGADLSLGQSLVIRAGYSLGDRDAFGAGIALRIPRKVVVRNR